jgi:hypothetical protein
LSSAPLPLSLGRRRKTIRWILKVCGATQKLLFENQFVRVIDDQIPPGVTEPMHRHRHGVAVYLNTYVNEQMTQDGKKSRQERKAGTANWANRWCIASRTSIRFLPTRFGLN